MSKNNVNNTSTKLSAGLVPKLRFPEFINDGNWNYDSVENLISTISPPKKLISSEYLATGKYPIVDQSQNFYCGWTNDSDALLNKNLPLIIFGDHTCILKLVDKPFAQGADGIKIIKPNKTLTTEFLFQYFNFNGVKQDGYKRHYSILKEKIVSYPNINTGEQQKIAACLSSLDDVITAESQKLELLKDHKKGLLQNLLPQAGETLPKLSFSKEPNWKEFNLPEMVYFQEGPGIMAVDFCDEGVPLIRLSGISGSTVTLDGCNFLNPEKVKNKWSHFRLVPNDLLISTSATFGLTSIVTEGAEGAVFYTGLIRFRSINNNLSLGYLKSFLGSPLFERQAKSAAVGGGIKHFGPTHLKQMKITLPSLDEQEKIANTLSSVDDLIKAQNEKVEELQLHKKGLLQGLFPNVNEVTE